MGARPEDKRPPRTEFSEGDYLEPREKVPSMTEFLEDDYLAPSVTVRKAPRVRFPSPIRRDAHDTRKKANKSTGVNMKPATYGGLIPWQDNHCHSEACADLNGWTERRALTLAVSLIGNAFGVLGNFPQGEIPDNYELYKVL